MGKSHYIYLGDYIEIKNKNFSFYLNLLDSLDEDLAEKISSRYRTAGNEMQNIILLNTISESDVVGKEWDMSYQEYSFHERIEKPNRTTGVRYWKEIEDVLSSLKINYEMCYGFVVYSM